MRWRRLWTVYLLSSRLPYHGRCAGIGGWPRCRCGCTIAAVVIAVFGRSGCDGCACGNGAWWECATHRLSCSAHAALWHDARTFWWQVRKPLCGKMYDEFERLHAHMRLMLAQVGRVRSRHVSRGAARRVMFGVRSRHVSRGAARRVMFGVRSRHMSRGAARRVMFSARPIGMVSAHLMLWQALVFPVLPNLAGARVLSIA